MIQESLKSIAEQFHGGKPLIEIDFGGAQLNHMDKLYQVDLAIRKFPAPDSIWDGSNEVVLPVHEEPPIPPQNICQLQVAQNSATPTSPAKLKVHWKLKNTAWRERQRLYLQLRSIEESLQNAYGDFHAGVGDWQPVERLYLEYGEAINQANAFITAVYEDQEQYCRGRSKAWIASDEARAYREWMRKWGSGIPHINLPNRKSGVELDLKAGKRLWEIPDAPAQ